MEIKIDLDLPALISNAVSAEKIQPLLDKAISDAIKDAINDATSYHSPFRKELATQLKEAMPHGLAIDDIAKFQHVLNSALTSAVHGENAKAIQAALAAVAQKCTPGVPESIKLTELLKEARDDFHCEQHEAFYAEFEPSDHGGGWLGLDSNENCCSRHFAEIHLGFNKDGTIYSLRMDGKDITPRSQPDVISRFDSLLLGMYVGRIRLELDCDENDVRYAAQAQDD